MTHVLEGMGSGLVDAMGRKVEDIYSAQYGMRDAVSPSGSAMVDHRSRDRPREAAYVRRWRFVVP